MEYIEDSDRCPELEQVLQEIMDILASMTREERLAWFRHTMYAGHIHAGDRWHSLSGTVSL